MGRKPSLRALYLALGMTTSLCAVAGQADTRTVPIYDATQIAYDRYTVVKRVGVDDWRQSAFRIPAHRDIESAQQAIVSEAAKAGADGVINLTCFDQSDGWVRRDGYFCYGNAIRLKK